MVGTRSERARPRAVLARARPGDDRAPFWLCSDARRRPRRDAAARASCDNALCQRSAPDHVEVSSALNRREWSIRRNLAQCPLADLRGPRRLARELRDMARADPELVAADLERLRQLLGEQLTLW